MLLAAFQHKFGRDVEVMTQHLVDDVAVGWDELGTDLLSGTPPEIVEALTGGEQWPSKTLDHLITPDGSPPVRMTVTEQTAAAQDLAWGYVLRPHGIEVLSVPYGRVGPVVGWDTDPRAGFSNHPGHWPAPATTPARAAQPPRTAHTTAPGEPRTPARR
ncbi:hypothetical protein ACIBK8_25755 [Streptomyces sp. NPDC050161]|uniref:hypothetical protein n=1 Tax=Streptomyces sp. NPDC050161 TaxID=3365604 RepID=UPI0037948B16